MLVCTFPGFSVRNSQVQIAIASFSWVTVSTGGIILLLYRPKMTFFTLRGPEHLLCMGQFHIISHKY